MFFFGSIIIFRGAEELDGKIVGTLAGSIFLFIFVIVSEFIRNKAIKGWGSPYSEMEKEFVHLEKAGVEFAYHDVLNRYPTSMDVYEIYYEDMNDLSYDPKLMLLSITGVAQLIVYDDFNGGRINHYKSQRRFYPESVYSFILATDEAENIIREIERGRQMTGETQDGSI